MSVADLAKMLVRGSWPTRQNATVLNAAKASRDYLLQISQVDVNRVARMTRDPKVGRLLSSLARRDRGGISERAYLY
jgi:hypothetical protein